MEILYGMITPLAILGGLGLFFGAVLAIAGNPLDLGCAADTAFIDALAGHASLRSRLALKFQIMQIGGRNDKTVTGTGSVH